jgi:hypothetical protein
VNVPQNVALASSSIVPAISGDVLFEEGTKMKLRLSNVDYDAVVKGLEHRVGATGVTDLTETYNEWRRKCGKEPVGEETVQSYCTYGKRINGYDVSPQFKEFVAWYCVRVWEVM